MSDWKSRAEPASTSWRDRATAIDSPPQEEPGLGAKALDYGLRALDYGGGLIRTAGAGLANIPYSIATGKSITQPEDVLNAFKGKSPTSAQYMERAGIPEGPHADLMPEFTIPGTDVTLGKGDTSLRDAEGLALDIATDPLTSIVKAVKPFGRAAESIGEGAYRSAFKKIDEKLAEKGTQPLSDVLLKNGAPIGTTKGISNKIGKIGDDLLKAREALYNRANDLGATVDMTDVTKNSEGLIGKMKTDPGLRAKAQPLEDLLNNYKSEGFVPVNTASDWKTNLYNALPDNAYDITGKVKGPAAKFQKQLANDFKNAIVNSSNAVEEGLGNKIGDINEDLSSIIQSKKPMANQIRKGNTPNFLTSTDPIVSGIGYAAGGAGGGAGLLAAKKAADLSKTTLFRTGLGKGLINIGNSGIDPILYRQILNGLIEDGQQ